MSRPEDARNSNERISDRAERYRFVSRVPLLCECSDPDCEGIFLIGLNAYREIRGDGFLTLPGHSVDGHNPTDRTEQYWQHSSSATAVTGRGAAHRDRSDDS